MSADTMPDLMTTEQLAEYLQIPVRTLEDWRSPRRKTGPRWIRLGKRIQYRRATVDAWLESQETADDPVQDVA
ncbi:helix-turn-helix domain-containing protein [Microbacterium sp. ZW T5_56]|uniref:helix-turn-helix domain-containing protein n=1 Tax=Microbacterium sp. ZW T5_56 TaxID=3378081 RepID=UPI003853B36C